MFHGGIRCGALLSKVTEKFYFSPIAEQRLIGRIKMATYVLSPVDYTCSLLAGCAVPQVLSSCVASPTVATKTIIKIHAD